MSRDGEAVGHSCHVPRPAVYIKVVKHLVQSGFPVRMRHCDVKYKIWLSRERLYDKCVEMGGSSRDSSMRSA
jgi:hypothetical protein